MTSRIVLLLTCLAFGACTPLAGRDARPATSSLSCMQQVRDKHVPQAAGPATRHCIAAGMIARYCSRSEAWMASYGKEFRDLFGRGDAQWSDLRADAHGIRCARSVTSDGELEQCCAGAVSSSASLWPKGLHST